MLRNKLLALLAGAYLSLTALASHAADVGDFAPGDTVCGFFNTYQPSTGASFTLASGAIRAYNVTSATEDADDSGLTLDNDFDTVTGYHQVCVDTSADGTFYAAGNRYSIILDAGTVDGVSVAGTEVLAFGLQAGTPGDLEGLVDDLESRLGTPSNLGGGATVAANLADIEGQTDDIGAAGAGLTAADDAVMTRLGAPAGASLSADIAAIEAQTDDIGVAGAGLTAIDLPNQTMDITGNITGNLSGSIGSVGSGGISEASFATTAGSFKPLGIIDQGTAQGATATTLQLRSAVTFADDELNGAEILITGGSAGVGQTRLITDYVSSTDTATVANWTTTPSGTITYQVRSDTATGGSVSIGAGGISASSFAAGAIDATAIATGAIDADAIADNAIDAGAIAANALTESEFNSAAGTFYPLGIIDQGTAQAATSTTLQLRSAADFANDEILGATILITGGSTGVGQSRTVTDYVSSTDTATVDAWTTTPTGTIEYKIYGTAPGGAGTTLTQADIRTAVGLASANLDTQLATIDDYIDTEVAAILDDTGTSGVQLPAGEITTATFGAGAIDAAAIAANAIGASEIADNAIDAGAIATDAITSAEVAATAVTELQSGLSTLDAAGIRTAVGLATANLDTQLAALPTAAENATEVLAQQRILVGTCSSGSTTTCVDAALTQADETQLDDRLICFDDSWCALITGFTPGSDTVTTTKTAPSTRASKAYTIFPATAQ